MNRCIIKKICIPLWQNRCEMFPILYILHRRLGLAAKILHNHVIIIMVLSTFIYEPCINTVTSNISRLQSLDEQRRFNWALLYYQLGDWDLRMWKKSCSCKDLSHWQSNIGGTMHNIMHPSQSLPICCLVVMRLTCKIYAVTQMQ